MTTSVQTSRLVFIDLLRGWAILVMIETHVFNAMILPQWKQTVLFDVLNFINGLVAPSFLFVSGFVFILSSRRKIDKLRTFGTTFWRQVGRILLIGMIGYALHLPVFSFRRMVAETTSESWLKFYQADILHCIAVGWLFLFFSFIFIKSESRFRQWLLASGFLFVFAAPFIWDIDFLPFLPAPIAAYLNGQHYSIFPLFPWLGFMLMGSVVALRYVEVVQEGRGKDFILRLVWIGGSLLVLSLFLSFLPMQFASVSTNWQANPLFFFMRLGIVFLLMGVCWYYGERRSVGQKSLSVPVGQESSAGRFRFPESRSLSGIQKAGNPALFNKLLSREIPVLPFVFDVSRESFLVYVAHLLIIYGEYFNGKSIESLYGKTFNILDCAIATLVLVALMIATAKFWGWLKGRSLAAPRAISVAFAVVTVVLFFSL